MGVGMVAYFEIEIRQIAELLAAQIKPSFRCQVALIDPGQFEAVRDERPLCPAGKFQEESGKKPLSASALRALAALSTDRIAVVDRVQSAHVGHVADKIFQR